MRGLIIGASSGIGAKTLSKLDPNEWEAPTKQELDVASDLSCERYFKDHDLRWTPYTHIIFSAGINYLEWLGRAESYHMQEVVDVNLMGFINVLNEITLRQDAPARVVVVGSDAAERPLRTSIAYCASKAGLHMAVRVAARELGPKGWRINCVAPGMTDETGMQRYVDERVQVVRGWTEEGMLKYEDQQTVVPGRISTEEVADVILSTLQGPDHLNGSIITLNGGR
jgi:NAD(P)-dependent dehydrogenase (short-subunit alcohol dehydrogenase family)